MSRRGNCWDNAVDESFFSSLKKELVKKRIYKTRDLARADIFDYIEVFYNRQRRHSQVSARRLSNKPHFEGPGCRHSGGSPRCAPWEYHSTANNSRNFSANGFLCTSATCRRFPQCSPSVLPRATSVNLFSGTFNNRPA